jgi:hypothetical protein
MNWRFSEKKKVTDQSSQIEHWKSFYPANCYFNLIYYYKGQKYIRKELPIR